MEQCPTSSSISVCVWITCINLMFAVGLIFCRCLVLIWRSWELTRTTGSKVQPTTEVAAQVLDRYALLKHFIFDCIWMDPALVHCLGPVVGGGLAGSCWAWGKIQCAGGGLLPDTGPTHQHQLWSSLQQWLWSLVDAVDAQKKLTSAARSNRMYIKRKMVLPICGTNH